MKKLIFFMLIALTAFAQQPIKKSKVKVLYVGQNPAREDGYQFGGNLQVWNEVRKDRAKVFYDFLKKYFKKVKMVYGEDYRESMSKKYDVTVFDALPPFVNGKMSSGYLNPNNPGFLTDDYDAATVFIAGVGGAMLFNKNMKINWLCNCLDSHAYGMDENHPIFNKPHKVAMTKENRKHNKGVYNYYSGRDLPTGEVVSMLRIQNVDDLERYPPGIVASPGLGDSADAEFIANGPSIKSVNAVALGRHGNFFQWGYRADPRHLTEAGQLALINAIHYMVPFKGKKPFVKRKAEHRLFALDEVYKASDKGYNDYIKLGIRVNDLKDKARLRKLMGTPESSDKYFLQNESKFPDRTRFIKYFPKKILKKYQYDWNAYLKYYEDNIGYVRIPENTYQGYFIDEDIQALGIANNDIRLLKKCIEMLGEPTQATLGKKLLERYTTQSFTTQKQWQKWFKKNEQKLFFTDTGGYKWMVDGYS